MALTVQQRRMAAIVVGVAAIVVAAGIAATLMLGGGDKAKGGGKEVPLLDGRLIVEGRPGWATLDSAPEAASLRVDLVDPGGRELLATLVMTTIPGAGSLERTLTVDGGTRFEVKGPSGVLQATAVPGSPARVVAGITRPNTAFFLSLSVFATDGNVLEVPALKTLFSEQVAPVLRFPT